MSLFDYQRCVEELIAHYVETLPGPKPIRSACAFALKNGGKRFRPIIVLMIADALGQKRDVSMAALSIEMFHTASLVVDDLPCMDDDDERRSLPALHKATNEAMALLVSYALIAEGYACIGKNAAVVNDASLALSALENASFNTGVLGAVGGQFLDLSPPDQSWETLKQILYQKTVSLFEIAFVTGWLFGGGSPSQLGSVKKLAAHFGLAFQLLDDCEDVDQDKARGKLVNVAVTFGLEKAEKLFHEELLAYFETLEQLQLAESPLKLLGDYLFERSAKKQTV